jgi:hypothetical protein
MRFPGVEKKKPAEAGFSFAAFWCPEEAFGMA